MLVQPKNQFKSNLESFFSFKFWNANYLFNSNKERKKEGKEEVSLDYARSRRSEMD